MVDDQRTVGAGSEGGWPSDSEYEPTQLAGSEGGGGSNYEPTQFAGGGGVEERPTPKTIPAEDLEGWPPSPPPPPPPPPSPPPDSSPFRPTSDQSNQKPPSPPAASEASGGKTMLIMTEPEPQIPLAWLVVVDGPGSKRGTIFTLKSETIVGRSYGELVLDGDATISSQHIKVRLEPKEEESQEAARKDEEVKEQDIFVLYDLASANGTFVGNQQTYRDEESRIYRHELHDGDYMLLGETTLVFKQID